MVGRRIEYYGVQLFVISPKYDLCDIAAAITCCF